MRCIECKEVLSDDDARDLVRFQKIRPEMPCLCPDCVKSGIKKMLLTILLMHTVESDTPMDDSQLKAEADAVIRKAMYGGV